MATLLCHITINKGKEEAFEAVMLDMYRRTHAEEPDCLRYEYFRGAEPRCYYCLLSYGTWESFLLHQVSDYHEGHDFAGMIESLQMEWVDPVQGASPLPATSAEAMPANLNELLRQAAKTYPVGTQAWWQDHRAN